MSVGVDDLQATGVELVRSFEGAVREFDCTGSESAQEDLELARSNLSAYMVSLQQAVEAPKVLWPRGWRITETGGGEVVVAGPCEGPGSMTLPNTEDGSLAVRLLRALSKALLSQAGALANIKRSAEEANAEANPWNVDRNDVLSWLGERDLPLTVENAWRARVALAGTPGTGQVKKVELTVRMCSFPESNGKRNWTAMFVRKTPWQGLVGNCGGITIARGENWNRVAYEAECARALIGERDTEPHILDYGDDIQTREEWAGEVRGGRPVRAGRTAPT